MAWVTPKTDWADTDLFTYADANRIMGNLNYLYPEGDLREDYTQDDVIMLSEWESMLASLLTLVSTTGYEVEGDYPDDTTTAFNFNAVESLTQALYDWIELINRQSAAKIYAGDGVYASENYAR